MYLLSQNIQKLLNTYGRQATLVKNTYGAYDPSTGSVSVSSSDSYTVKAYFGNYSVGEIDGDKIAFGDRQVYLGWKDTSGNTVPVPDLEDRITGVGDNLRIIRVQQIYNADELVCYVCQARE